MTRSKPVLGLAKRIKNPAKKGRYNRPKVVAVAFATKPSGPCSSARMSKSGNAIAVATARPATPPTQAAYDRPIVAKVSVLNEIAIPRAANARTNSRTPKTTAIATTIAKISR